MARRMAGWTARTTDFVYRQRRRGQRRQPRSAITVAVVVPCDCICYVQSFPSLPGPVNVFLVALVRVTKTFARRLRQLTVRTSRWLKTTSGVSIIYTKRSSTWEKLTIVRYLAHAEWQRGFFLFLSFDHPRNSWFRPSVTRFSLYLSNAAFTAITYAIDVCVCARARALNFLLRGPTQ